AGSEARGRARTARRAVRAQHAHVSRIDALRSLLDGMRQTSQLRRHHPQLTSEAVPFRPSFGVAGARMTVRLLGVGAAAPALRLAAADVGAAWGRSGRGQAAVCAPDEDMLTLGWDAATRALAAAGIEPERVDALCWGTSRPPFAEGPSLAFLAAALGCSSAVGGVLCAGSAHAGMEALAAAADAIAAGSARVALLVSSGAVRRGRRTGFVAR